MSKIAVKRPVTTVMIILIAVGLGIMSVFNLQLEAMPSMNMPVLTVRTSYTGAGPEEVLEQVTKTVENAVSTLDGLDTMTSRSSSGSSMVMLEFDDDIDIDTVYQEASEAINRISSRLPDDASEPTLMKMAMDSSSIMTVSISSDTLSQVEMKSIMDNTLEDRLTRISGVASVDVTGGREEEIVVEIIEDKAAGYGITLSNISQLLSSENQDTAGGNVQEGTKSINVKTKGSLKSIRDIENLVITTSSGANILLSDVANVSRQYKEVTSYSFLNGRNNLNLQISKQSTANTVSVSDALTEEVEAIRAEYPDLTISITSDSADDVRTSINAVIEAAWQGMLLAVIVLFIFLRNIRSTIVIALAMPISIVATFALMYFYGMTLNTMSLSGLVLGVGMLVDNSIVVLESIFRRMEEGESRVNAAINGAKEVSMSITASTLTTVCVFLPITFIGGVVAQYFNDLAFTIAFSLLASLVVALTFVPMCSSLILAPETQSINPVTRRISNAVNSGIESMTNGYKKSLDWVICHKLITIIICIAFFCLTMLSLGGLGQEFMTFGTAGEVNLTLTPPDGTVLEETLKIAEEAQERLDAFGDVIEITTLRVQSSSVRFQITLIDGSLREKDNDTITSEIRAAMSTMAGVEISTAARMFGGGSGSGLSISIYGNDTDTLAEIGDDLVAILNEVDGFVEATSSISSANQEAVVVINRAKAAKYGVSASSVASLINSSINGATPTTIKTDGDEIDVTVRYADDKLKYLTDVSDLMITTNSGSVIPLSELAEISKENASNSISRLDQRTYITVSASLEGVDSGAAMTLATDAINNNYIMPNGYSWEFGSDQRMMTDAFAGLGQALILALFLVYAIMAAEFESLYYPFIIMFSIPIAISSGLFGLRITNSSLSITAYLGLIMLAGVVINNAIVLIDYINILRREQGMELVEAVKTAGPVRLRAILMSTVTTVLGLVPMAIGLSEGSETMQPLAIVVVFGLTISTLVTLLLIPVLYILFENIRARFSAFLIKKNFGSVAGSSN